jgi:hypothetical protein
MACGMGAPFIARQGKRRKKKMWPREIRDMEPLVKQPTVPRKRMALRFVLESKASGSFHLTVIARILKSS